jgi:hypothetical protein
MKQVTDVVILKYFRQNIVEKIGVVYSKQCKIWQKLYHNTSFSAQISKNNPVDHNIGIVPLQTSTYICRISLVQLDNLPTKHQTPTLFQKLWSCAATTLSVHRCHK